METEVNIIHSAIISSLDGYLNTLLAEINSDFPKGFLIHYAEGRARGGLGIAFVSGAVDLSTYELLGDMNIPEDLAFEDRNDYDPRQAASEAARDILYVIQELGLDPLQSDVLGAAVAILREAAND